MKFFWCGLILFVSVEFSFGQNYHPVLEKNRYWDVLGMSIQQTGPCGYGFGYRYQLAGDTLFNGMQYHIVRSFNIQTADGNLYFCPPYIVSTTFSNYFPEFYLREDTVQRKLFFLHDGFDTEELLFDYNLNVGDSLISTCGHLPL